MDSTGKLLPDAPRRCPRGRRGAPCAVRVKGRRERKTGPVSIVWVFRCETHGRAFTVYAPGCVPHGRIAVVHVTPDGQPVAGAELLGDTTFFGAALQAAKAQVWPDSASALDGLARADAQGAEAHDANADAEPGGVRRTQRRRQRGAAKLLGLLVGGDRIAERIAEAFDVPLVRLRDFRSAYERACGWAERAVVIRDVLRALPRSLALLKRVVRAGAIAGLWPHPRGCDPGGAHREPF